MFMMMPESMIEEMLDEDSPAVESRFVNRF